MLCGSWPVSLNDTGHKQSRPHDEKPLDWKSQTQANIFDLLPCLLFAHACHWVFAFALDGEEATVAMGPMGS